MFGIGMTELLVIMAVALVVFGPKRLPELARSLGRALGEFRHASNDLRQTLSETPIVPEAPPSTAKPGVAAAAESGDAASSTGARAPADPVAAASGSSTAPAAAERDKPEGAGSAEPGSSA